MLHKKAACAAGQHTLCREVMDFARVFEISDASWKFGVCGFRTKLEDPVLAIDFSGRSNTRADSRLQPSAGEVPPSNGRLASAPPTPVFFKEGRTATPPLTPSLSAPAAAAAAAMPAFAPHPKLVPVVEDSPRTQELVSLSLYDDNSTLNAMAAVDDSSDSEADLAYQREMLRCRDRLKEALNQAQTAVTQPKMLLSAAGEEDAGASRGILSAKGSPAISSTCPPSSSSPASTRAASRTVSATEVSDLPPEAHGAPARTLRPVVGLTLGEQFGEPGAAPPLAPQSEQDRLGGRRASALQPPACALQLPTSVSRVTASLSARADALGADEPSCSPRDRGEGPDVHELYERANIGERMKQMRRRLIAGGETPPEPGSHWSAGSPQTLGKEVEDYQLVFRQKLELLGAADARSRALQPNPVSHSAAVKDAVRHYHEHCQDIGELYAMPGEQRQRGLSAEHAERLAAYSRDLSGEIDHVVTAPERHAR